MIKTTRAVYGLALLAVLLSSCVTINIYFPAAAAEKAADKIIDDVWQIQPDAKAPASKPADSKPAAK